MVVKINGNKIMQVCKRVYNLDAELMSYYIPRNKLESIAKTLFSLGFKLCKWSIIYITFLICFNEIIKATSSLHIGFVKL